MAAIKWIKVADSMPDSDTTVLITTVDDTEPVWLGYHDGYHWRSVDSIRINVSHWRSVDSIRINVSHWADLPNPAEEPVTISPFKRTAP